MSVAARSQTAPTVAIIGNPNTGKTTLFNALTGLNHKVANYPGVTVERKAGLLRLEGLEAELIDLPGTYSLAARSPDEMIVADALLGQQTGLRPLDAVIAVVDAANLERNLYLVSQLLTFDGPIVVALNMMDAAQRREIAIDVDLLSRRLGLPVIPVRADRGEGVDALRRAVRSALHAPRGARATFRLPHEMERQIDRVDAFLQAQAGALGRTVYRDEAGRALIDEGGAAESRLVHRLGPAFGALLADARAALAAEARVALGSPRTPAAVEAQARYAWTRTIVEGCVTRPDTPPLTLSERLDAILTHRLWGSLALFVTLAVVFQAIYLWAQPAMDLIATGFHRLGGAVASVLPAGPLQSLICDGAIDGVGAVVAFLPQILLLFFFIGILEDCGYMARAAFLMDKLLARFGLSGKSVIPLLSSFACAVPGIMAARTIEDRRDRIATILVAPLMSCSARLPVYTLMIGAFVPAKAWVGGWIGLQGLALFAAHFIGVAVAAPAVWVIKRWILRGATPPFVLEMPEYRLPSWRAVLDRLISRARAFLRRAGTVIFAVTILVWALTYFPHPPEIHARYEIQRAAATAPAEHIALDREESQAYIAQSAFGRLGRVVEPIVAPLGWDWRIGVAAIASFPAREVVIATLGTIMGVGGESDAHSSDLKRTLQSATWPDGRALFTLPVALSLVVFFALCCQCVSTLVVMRRETGSWWWSAFAFTYMTVLAWLGAFVTFHGARMLGI